MTTDWPEYGVFANVVSDGTLRVGAKVLVLRTDGDAVRPEVRGLNRHGREITKRVHMKNLTKFRAGWLTQLRRIGVFSHWTGTKEKMAALAARLNDTYKEPTP